jgi:hypothetical protein
MPNSPFARRRRRLANQARMSLVLWLDALSMTMFGKCMPRRRAQEFRKFLDEVEWNAFRPISTSTTGFVVLAVFTGLALGPPTIVLEMPATAKLVLLLVIFAWTIGISILSWYFSSMTVDVTVDELGWRFAPNGMIE